MENNELINNGVTLEEVKDSLIEGLLQIEFAVPDGKYVIPNDDANVKMDVNSTVISSIYILEAFATDACVSKFNNPLELFEGVFRYISLIKDYNEKKIDKIEIKDEKDRICFAFAIMQMFKIAFRVLAYNNGMTNIISREEAIQILEQRTGNNVEQNE